METGRWHGRFSSWGGCQAHKGSRKMKSVFAAAMFMTAMIQVAHAQDVAAGEQSFKKCFPCHWIGEGAKNKVGPELNGLDGRHSGSAPDYNYSDSNKNSGITWSEALFTHSSTNPRTKI